MFLIQIPPTKSLIPLNFQSNVLTLAPIFKLATIFKHKYKYENLTLIIDALSSTKLALSVANRRRWSQELSCSLASKPYFGK
jgi:hypothetical protein